jgi:hypothetical protein
MMSTDIDAEVAVDHDRVHRDIGVVTVATADAATAAAEDDGLARARDLHVTSDATHAKMIGVTTMYDHHVTVFRVRDCRQRKRRKRRKRKRRRRRQLSSIPKSPRRTLFARNLD